MVRTQSCTSGSVLLVQGFYAAPQPCPSPEPCLRQSPSPLPLPATALGWDGWQLP